MAVAVKVVSTGKGSGASELAKYISERERHPEREGGKAREIFGQDVDGLKDKSASRHLTRGLSNQAQKKDVFHFVISPAEKEFERSGRTNHDRKEVYKEATRQTMREIEREAGARELRWVAAIHLNTKTPHIHVLVHKAFHDAEGNSRRFHRLPNLDTRKTDPTKLIHNRFEQNLDTAIERGRVRQEVDWSRNWKYPEPRVSYEPKPEDVADRVTLGKAMVAREAISGRALDLALERFTITVKDKEQTTSEAELDNSIKKASLQTVLWTYAKEGVPGLEKLTRRVNIGLAYLNKTIDTIDRVTNAPFLKSEAWVNQKEQQLLIAIESIRPMQAFYDAKDALDEWYMAKSQPIYQAIEEKKRILLEDLKSVGRPEVREQYQVIREAEAISAAKPDIAAAILDPDSINRLQDTYLRHFDAEGLKRLEEVRVTNAYENKPMQRIEARTIEEMALLEGQHTVMEATLAATRMSGQFPTPEEHQTFQVLTTILEAERNRFLEQGIRVAPVATPREQDFVDRVATITGNAQLMNRYFEMAEAQTSERLFVRTEILKTYHPQIALGMEDTRQEDIPLIEGISADSLYTPPDLTALPLTHDLPKLADLPETDYEYER
ncbi:MAG: hypothetical protein JST84_05080 [Acidobacteria bacterium]|nr:hypothetical protein [Acidobacteriota bacterium]